MLHMEEPAVRQELLKGSFGLELESLRITENGRLSQSVHPFPGNERIDRDFSECQTEFNTEVFPTAQTAAEALKRYYTGAQRVLAELPEPETFWPFSNPPALHGEAEIPVAQYYGEKAQKTDYREYLSDRYGRYKMTFSGIHVNFSFSDELIEAEAAARGTTLRETKDRIYLDLAERAVEYGWLLTACTAASPVLDRSYNLTGGTGDDFFGLSSIRCSELGYWNFFSPVLDYSSMQAYTDSIQSYVTQGLIRQFSELYYPIRLKPRGSYSLENLKKTGVNHIELRMFDLNPLVFGCIDARDVEFAQLLLVYLAAGAGKHLTQADQVQAVQNFKTAAHFDLDTVKLTMSDGVSRTARQAAIDIIRELQMFYRDAPEEEQEILAFELRKFTEPETSYAWQVLEAYGTDYFRKGLTLALQRRQEALNEAGDSVR